MLLVEDNVINMEIAHEILGEEHLNITEAKNGKEALEIFHSYQDRYLNIQTEKQLYSHHPIILRNEHIGKPIDIPRLKRAITKLLTKKG